MKRLLSLLTLVLSSCGLLPRSTQAPVPTITGGSSTATELVVFLPGRWSTVDEFEREGFFKIAAARWPAARLVAADLHLGYYKSRSSAKRVHEDIIAPARKSGVKTVRVVGVSMGGLGALIHDLEYPGDIDEIYLLSPFVGEEDVIAEIGAAGGAGDEVAGAGASADGEAGLRDGGPAGGIEPAVRGGFLEEGRGAVAAGRSRLAGVAGVVRGDVAQL
jgi:pimeloyl-ACP methyl ester carboxylesterase